MRARLLLLLLLAAGFASAEQPPAAVEPRQQERDDEGLLERVDDTHETVSRQVENLGIRLDRLFGGREFVPDHSSYVRLRTTTLLREGGSEVEPRLRARVALPNTERRLSLVLESEDDARYDRDDGHQPSSPTGLRSSGNDNGFVAGLRYLQDLWGWVDLDTDAGVRLRSGLPNPYVRARVGRSVPLGSWQLRPSQELYWHEYKGSGARTQMIVQREFSSSRLFRSISEIDWVYRERHTYYAQDFVFSHELSDLHAVQAMIGARGESHPQRLAQWFVNVAWRRSIYKDWLFLELRPEVLFEHEQDYQGEPRLFLTLEAYFGRYR